MKCLVVILEGCSALSFFGDSSMVNSTLFYAFFTHSQAQQDYSMAVEAEFAEDIARYLWNCKNSDERDSSHLYFIFTG